MCSSDLLIIKIAGYHAAIESTAVKSLLDSYGVQNLRQLYRESGEKLDDERYRSSVSNKLIDEELKTLSKASIFLRTQSPLPEHNLGFIGSALSEPDLKEKLMRSIRQQIKEDFLPRYKNKRKLEAKALKKEFNLKKNQVENIQTIAFKEAVRIINSGKPIRIPQSSKESIIRTLEEGIEIWFPIWLQHLKINLATNLTKLRKNGSNKFNTACWRCDKLLNKRDGSHYCNRSENRSCYNARLKETKRSEFPDVIIRTKNRCDMCGRHSSLDYIHKHKGRKMQFCSNRCWERFRKKEWRRNKKT